HALLAALLPLGVQDRRPYTLANLWFSLLSFHVLLIVVLWLLGMVLGTVLGTVLGRQAAGRRLAPITLVLYAVALLDSLYVTLLLVGKDATYTTLVLAVFALLALLAGVRERQTLVGNLFVGFFGVLATLPVAVGRDTNGVAVALVALVPAVLALIIR